MAIGMSVQSECECFMVSENIIWETSRKYLKCLHSQQFPIEGTITSFSWGHLPGEELNWMPGTVAMLLKNSTNSSVRRSVMRQVGASG